MEYYYSQSGFVSASVFRKKLTNYIVDVTQQLDADTAADLGIAQSDLGSPFDQYDVSYKFNVPDAGYYDGIELGFQQNFTFLPNRSTRLASRSTPRCSPSIRSSPTRPSATARPTRT